MFLGSGVRTALRGTSGAVLRPSSFRHAPSVSPANALAAASVAPSRGISKRTKVKPVAGLVPYGLRKAIKVRGVDGKGVITDPTYNKGMGFSHGERDRMGIRGLVVSHAARPPHCRLQSQPTVGTVVGGGRLSHPTFGGAVGGCRSAVSQPPRYLTMENQVERVLIQLEKEDTPIKKALFMRDLHDRNETLYHRGAPRFARQNLHHHVLALLP